jgi:acetyl esterase/lipase
MKIKLTLLGALGCLLLGASGVAAAAPAPTPMPLWPDAVTAHGPTRGPEQVGRNGKGVGAVSNISQPRMEIYRAEHPNGSAVVVIGGGGYFRIQMANESVPVAQWLSALGVTAAVLYYRLPGDGWPAAAPFQDGQRAVRLLRAHAAELGIDPQKIGVIGMSAGGNLAAIISTRFDTNFYEALDDADKLSARPDFEGLIYPVISLQPPFDTTRSRRELGTQKDAVEAYSAELHVTHSTPPTFLAQAADDPIAAIGNSLVMFNALHAQSVPAEMHVFENGGHGWGLGVPGSLVSAWPRLFATWARSHGFMGGTPVGPAPSATPAPARERDDG